MVQYNLGAIFAKENNYQKALEHWLKSKERDPGDPLLLANLGWVYEKTKQRDKAIKEYKLSIAADPFNPHVHFNLGRLETLRGNHSEAIESFKKAINLNPDYIEAYYRIGIVYDTIQDGGNAITNTIIAEMFYKNKNDLNMAAKAGENLRLFFGKYHLRRVDFADIALPDSLLEKGKSKK
ncbi:hypothetical protein UZ36_05045 [Candidatus Nitromaritima sp. SCGC AAA799-C22]|nr:hypothetical protein UZ36_05045 [Candidatus Nitromaritima sp. SCGC AAA799-C22]